MTTTTTNSQPKKTKTTGVAKKPLDPSILKQRLEFVEKRIVRLGSKLTKDSELLDRYTQQQAAGSSACDQTNETVAI